MSWQDLINARNVLIEQTVQHTKAAINNRPVGVRNEAADNLIFHGLGAQMMTALYWREFRLAILMFDECYAEALAYEARHGCEMHKGAPCFNVGLAYLQCQDTVAAMHYFELAQQESRKTSGDNNWDIFLNEPFEANYWNGLDKLSARYPNQIYKELWVKPFDKTEAMADWRNLTEHSRLLYIMANAQRMRYRLLAEGFGWDGSQDMALVYWTLAADLGRLVENRVETHHR